MEEQLDDAEPSVESDQHIKAQELKNSGNEKFNRHNYKGAVVDYQKGLLHEPNNPELHTNLSAAYLNLEKYIEAEDHALFAIHLKPNFYKGYMRAAKADHGKGMTRLALKRLAQGIANVTDINGLKELNRLKNQYTSYLLLQSNFEQEPEFDSDAYQSEDEEDEGLSTDDSSGDDQPSFPINKPELCVIEAPPVPTSQPALPPQSASPSPLTVSVPPEDICGAPEPDEITELFADIEDELEKQDEPVKSESEVVDDSESPVEPDGIESCTAKEAELQKDTPANNPVDKPEHPLDRLRELARSSEMKKNIAEFKENLKEGGEAYLSGNYRKAADNYKAAYERVGKRYFDFETEERQCNVIRYASYAAMINRNTYDDIVKSIHGLNDMTKFACDFPAIYIQMARGYYKLNRFKTALEPLEKVQAIIDNIPIFPTFIWPGTNETIEETTPIGLKNSIKELNQLCRMSHKPTAVCRYDNCLNTTSHIVPAEIIYSTDPDFIGYVRMVCEEKCHIEFHISCWKSYKESVFGIGKINDKDLLGRPCLTTDCINSEATGPSIITSIEIIGSDGLVKSVNKLDPKANSEQRAAEKKAKKKKSKLDDKENKEKVTKPRKTREKKIKIKQIKQVDMMQEDENDEEDDYRTGTKPSISAEPKKDLEKRKQLMRLTRYFDRGITDWDIRKSYYGNDKEIRKASEDKFYDHSNDLKEVKDIKNFCFSYFQQILSDEGPLRLKDVEEHWKEQAGDICDIKTVLPDLKSVCDLLMESYRFCQLEDHLCLADLLDDGYKSVVEEVADTVVFLMSRAGSCDTDSQQTDSIKDGSVSGEESEDESSSDSEESEDDGSDDDDMGDENNYTSFQTMSQPPPPTVVLPNMHSDGKFSLEDILKEMSRMKNELDMETKVGEDSSPLTSENEPSKEQSEETNPDETFETAHGSSANSTAEDVKMIPLPDSPISEISNKREESDSSCHMESETLSNIDRPHSEATDHRYNCPEVQKPFESTECDKGSQSEWVVTEERHIQTAPLETKDRISQTKESDLYKELNKKVQELSVQLAVANKENARLSKELVSEKQILKAQHDTIAKLHDEGKRNIDALHEQMKIEILKRDNHLKKREGELTEKINSMKDVNSNLLQDIARLKKEMGILLKENADVKQSLTSASTSIKESESNHKSLEVSMKSRLQKALQSQLLLVKSFWESQLNLQKKRCVERITEMQSWFNLVGSPGEVESLPSYPLIKQNTMQWMEMAKQLQQIESDFQEKYTGIAKKIDQFDLKNDMNDLKPDILPIMPKEPSVPPLDKIHKEITDKHLKTISDLTQLVVNQQLQIEKSKEQSDQLTQFLMSSLQSGQVAPPRLPQPITPAFGGLAMQYSYPGAGALPVQYPKPAVSPAGQEAVVTGNSSKLSDVHALLQESSKMFSLSSTVSSLLPPSLQDEASSQTPQVGSSYPTLYYPTLKLQPPPAAVPGPILSMPPPPIGVAQSIYKNSSVTTEPQKDSKPLEQREGTPKPEQKVKSSRESTPVPTPAPAAPTPEKSKKKKKTKSGEAAAAEARLAAAVTLDLATSAPVDDAERDDGSEWNVVLPKNAIPKNSTQFSALVAEGKMKNKKKLMDKLQIRFPTIPIKEIEDMAKQVREQNNGSLSGLPFDEIEARVERLIMKRQIQKNSTMGLIKFSDVAWGVKPKETKTWSNLQLEECTICLEPMGNERTKVECNHEFHTKCLRKWLKEKSVCPLCNKFTTMPDEFPAL